jgi:hypothetical protein
MSDTDDPIVHDTLEVDDDGYVTGSAYTRKFGNGYSIQLHVTSYEYERNNDTRMNHVPIVVVERDGIECEPHVRDSRSARTAIESARGAARDIANNPERYDLA